MEFINLLFQRSKLFYVALGSLSIVNGLLNIGLLMFINNAIAERPIPFLAEYDWMVFGGLFFVSLLSSKLFQTYMIRLTNNINFDFEIAILKKVRAASFQRFERLGTERVFTAINDIRALVNLPEIFMSAINSFILLACCFAYLFWISWIGGSLILGIMLALLVFYLVRNRSIERDLEEVRSLQNSYYQYLIDLLKGFKEVKISGQRSVNIFEKFLFSNRSKSKDLSLKAGIKYMDNELTGTYSWYVILGVILFALPQISQLAITDVAAYLITILYMIGPVAILITLIPTYTHVKIAMGRLSDFSKVLNQHIDTAAPDETAIVESEIVHSFQSLRFEEVEFVYDSEEGETESGFRLGPISLEFRRGELVFITGGNGSGKSTFINIVTGLYKPTAGTVFLNNEPIDYTDHSSYRELIAAIFTHPHLFSENYDGFEINTQNQTLTALLERLELREVVQFDETRNRIPPKLSKGQSKRLAMVYALMEEKPILILDEWAAEQDPAYRAYFYKQLLPDLQRQGKTIIAVTHDDFYYGLADRIIKFDYGTVASDQPLLATHATP